MSCIMYVENIFTLKKKIEKEHQKVISMVGAKIPLGSLVLEYHDVSGERYRAILALLLMKLVTTVAENTRYRIFVLML